MVTIYANTAPGWYITPVGLSTITVRDSPARTGRVEGAAAKGTSW